ncbi:TonB-dependent receptor [Sphingobium sp. HBC34]|uniref:TonB-dependent receptor n=1 Tax=Sphingobium cyanobacteriorum TaxID=3063954 RepID=A0ABT8ZP76_9SPHN|nr:TonB-dependent receptor [Sphingobium sp. HBC34]MDO7836339.1 TonB-dependent receptor [Sphingobium sp. HBC34]
MKISVHMMLAASAIALSHGAAHAADAAANTAPEEQSAEQRSLADIIVTARRSSENLQSVPVAVSVLTDAQFKNEGTFRPEDMQKSVPGLSIAAGGDTDRGNLTFVIRGQGTVYGSLFPAVITYFNEVPIKTLGVGQFYDTQSLQVLRGPQGVQFGRVTDGGNIMLTPNRPTGDYSAEISLKAGTYNLLGTEGFINVPISGDKVALRFGWDVTRRDGFTKNLYNGKDLDNVNYQGGRLSLLLKPSDSFENLTVVQYQHVDDNGTSVLYDAQNNAGVIANVGGFIPLVSTPSDFGIPGFSPIYGLDGNGSIRAFQTGDTPLTVGNYINAIQSAIARQKSLGKRKTFNTAPVYNKRHITYITNTTTATLSDNLELKNVFGYTRYLERSAQNYTGDNSGYVQPCHDACPWNPGGNIPFIDQEQFSEELRLSGNFLDGKLTWSLGGYMDEQRPGRKRIENDTIFGGILEYDVVQHVKTKSRAIYGYAEYEVAPSFKINGGLRYTSDKVHSFNAVYNALLPVPGLERTLLASFTTFRDAGFGFTGLTDEQLAGLAAATANGAANVPHGQCANYNGGIFQTTCIESKASFDVWTWSAGASYAFDERKLLYAKVSKGYRPGGINSTFPKPEFRQYQPENDISVEVGLKTQFELGSMPVRANLALYRDRYTKIQQTITARGENGTPGSILTNVAAAKIYGLEFEGQISPFDGFTLGANYAYTHAKFDIDPNEDPSACDPTALVAIGFCTRNRFFATPKHQLGVNARWDFIQDDGGIGRIGIGGNLYHQSSAALAQSVNSFISPRGIEPKYTTFNLNASWNNIYNSNLDLTLFLTNVTNEIHRLAANSNAQNSGIGNDSSVYNAPRMFGATLTGRF